MKRSIKVLSLILLSTLGLVNLTAAPNKKVGLSRQEVLALSKADSPMVLLSRDGAKLITRLHGANKASHALKRCSKMLSHTKRLVVSDDLVQALFELDNASEQEVSALRNLLESLQPHALNVNDEAVVDFYIDARAKLNARSAKPYQTLTATVVPPHKHLVQGNQFITGELCAGGTLTALKDAIVCGRLTVGELVFKSNNNSLTFADICVVGDAKISGTLLTDSIDCNESDRIAVLCDLCVEPGSKVVTNRVGSKTPDGTVLFCDHIETVTGKDVTINGRLIVPGELVVSVDGDVMVPKTNCIYTDCIKPVDANGTTTTEHLAVVYGHSLRTGKIVDVAMNDNGESGTVSFCSSIIMDAGRTVSANLIAPHSGETLVLNGDVCVSDTLMIDSIAFKENGHLLINGDVCMTNTLQVDSLTNKDNGEILVSGDVVMCNTLFIDAIDSKDNDEINLLSRLCVDGDICLTGTLEADALTCADDDMLDIYCSVSVHGDMCIESTSTLYVDTIQPKTDGGVVMIPTLVANNMMGDVCVTGTLFSDAFDCKDNDVMDMLCSLSVTGNICSDLLLSDTIVPKHSGILTFFEFGSTANEAVTMARSTGEAGTKSFDFGRESLTSFFNVGAFAANTVAEFGRGSSTVMQVGGGDTSSPATINFGGDQTGSQGLVRIEGGVSKNGLLCVDGTVMTFSVRAKEGDVVSIGTFSEETDLIVTGDVCIEAGSSLLVDEIIAKSGGTIAIQNEIAVAEISAESGSSTITFNDEIDVLGNIKQNGSIIHISDKRVKTDITNLDSAKALENILNLKPSRYKMTSALSKTRTSIDEEEHGFIAQEVEKYLPHLVHVSETKTIGETTYDNFYSLDYTKMVVDLVAALQEQQKQLDAANKAIEELKALIA